jgi:hypothetical protein
MLIYKKVHCTNINPKNIKSKIPSLTNKKQLKQQAASETRMAASRLYPRVSSDVPCVLSPRTDQEYLLQRLVHQGRGPRPLLCNT